MTVPFDGILSLLADHLGQGPEVAPQATKRGRGPKVNISIDYDDPKPTTTHTMAGNTGYSLTSNWFAQRMGQLIVARRVSASQIAVFMYVAGGQKKGTGITSYTQQQITDGLNEEAVKIPDGKKITRPTVNKAVKALCDWGWLESAGYGRIRLNVTLWFNGNSGEQKEVLQGIASDHGNDPEGFPHKIGPRDIPGQQELDFENLPHAREATG
ncbi:hypothetical protein [Streptomyces sp. NBC_01264]|uniref:hypothetical protein n=1 Tax=Streptomyces sp. NBC_01264 TaxID=2903804 RepID=UPI00225964CF|nr:hypothetical protein [Streptomyces sp. NBC_01264]MCX4784598.1 hypothetical protein [Streptomyces sp. NBC_01264]